MSNNTIAAIITPSGQSGIACVRLSGEDSREIADRVFKAYRKEKNIKSAKGYTALYGHFVEDDVIKDEVVALIFGAPKSYTGEDVVELSCHGGDVVVTQLLRALIANGAVPAQGGEFTKRAFLNGKIGLTQAEAVMELISSSSKSGAAAAVAAMEGALYKKIKSVTEELTVLAGHIAAYTDFPEEDVDILTSEEMTLRLEPCIDMIKELVANYDKGAILRAGVETAIVGSPNVGKSTLLNLLSGFDRAIVTEIAGTTRDVVEQDVNIGGIRLLLADTAGIRETSDVVEAEGIKRSYTRMQSANLVLAVFDGSREITNEDILLSEHCKDKNAIALINKSDLDKKFDTDKLSTYFKSIVEIQANDKNSLDMVEKAVLEVLGIAQIDENNALLANERQLSSAEIALKAITEAHSVLLDGFTPDIAGVCIDEALYSLYSLTGENVSQTVVDEIFSKFCVGK